MTNEEFFAIGYLAYLQAWSQGSTADRPNSVVMHFGPYQARFFIDQPISGALLSRHDLGFEIDMGSRTVTVFRRHGPNGMTYSCEPPFTEVDKTALSLIVG